MRRMREAVLAFTGSNDGLPKTVREYREKYKGVSRILDDHPEILELVHEDLKRLSSGDRQGREGDFTSETILRETVVRIAESEFLQDFLRTRKRAVMDHTFLDKCFQAIQPATWKQLNAVLAQAAVKSGAIGVSTIRADCQLTEEVIERHEGLFEQTPEVLAADMGFCPDEEKYEELQGRVGTLAIPRRLRDLADAVLRMWRSFRAGIEGTISGLKRAFRLTRCHYRGFKRFAAALGLGVFAHNLVVLAKQAIA